MVNLLLTTFPVAISRNTSTSGFDVIFRSPLPLPSCTTSRLWSHRHQHLEVYIRYRTYLTQWTITSHTSKQRYLGCEVVDHMHVLIVIRQQYIVFESPVAWTGKRPKPNRTEPRSGSACGYLYNRSFAVQLPVFHFKNIIKPIKTGLSRLQPVHRSR